DRCFARCTCGEVSGDAADQGQTHGQTPDERSEPETAARDRGELGYLLLAELPPVDRRDVQHEPGLEKGEHGEVRALAPRKRTRDGRPGRRSTDELAQYRVAEPWQPPRERNHIAPELTCERGCDRIDGKALAGHADDNRLGGHVRQRRGRMMV